MHKGTLGRTGHKRLWSAKDPVLSTRGLMYDVTWPIDTLYLIIRFVITVRSNVHMKSFSLKVPDFHEILCWVRKSVYEFQLCGTLLAAQLVEALRYKSEDLGFDSRWRDRNFSLVYSFRPHYGPGVDSASNKKWVPGVFPGVKSGQCVRLTTLPPSCAVVMKSGNLNFLEPSGHLGPVMGLIHLYLRA